MAKRRKTPEKKVVGHAVKTLPDGTTVNVTYVRSTNSRKGVKHGKAHR